MSYNETATHVYFWGSYLSNFATAPFDYQFFPSGPIVRVPTSEHGFMALKALEFGDLEAFENVFEKQVPFGTKPTTPAEAKAVGRTVKVFDPTVWDHKSYQHMFDVCVQKFAQNEDLKEQLIGTIGKTLVEGSPVDRIWGVGLACDDPKILDEANWKGENRLGKILMQVRWSLHRHPDNLQYNPSKVLGTL